MSNINCTTPILIYVHCFYASRVVIYRWWECKSDIIMWDRKCSFYVCRWPPLEILLSRISKTSMNWILMCPPLANYSIFGIYMLLSNVFWQFMWLIEQEIQLSFLKQFSYLSRHLIQFLQEIERDQQWPAAFIYLNYLIGANEMRSFHYFEVTCWSLLVCYLMEMHNQISEKETPSPRWSQSIKKEWSTVMIKCRFYGYCMSFSWILHR